MHRKSSTDNCYLHEFVIESELFGIAFKTELDEVSQTTVSTEELI